MKGDRIVNQLLGFSKQLQGRDIFSSWDPVGLGQRTEPGTSKKLVLQAFYKHIFHFSYSRYQGSYICSSPQPVLAWRL